MHVRRNTVAVEVAPGACLCLLEARTEAGVCLGDQTLGLCAKVSRSDVEVGLRDLADRELVLQVLQRSQHGALLFFGDRGSRQRQRLFEREFG